MLLLLPPLRVSLALPLRCPGLVRILVSLQFAPGVFQRPLLFLLFCAAPVAPAAGLSAFPQLRLAPSLILLALLLSLTMLRLMLRCLGLLRLLPSSSLSVWLGSSCPLVRVCGSGRYRCCGSGSRGFRSHLCLPPLTLVSALMVAILTLAAGSSQAPLPTCSFLWSSS